MAEKKRIIEDVMFPEGSLLIKEIKIPKERIPVVIGKNGEIKKEIEEAANVKLNIHDSIEISGKSLNIMNAENIIKAIGRGFDPDNAFKLLEEENMLHIIQLPGNIRDRRRIRSRLIGTKGNTEKKLEAITKCDISVFGKTVAIIGRYEDVSFCTKAIEKLINGSPHKYVYQFLEKYKSNE